MKAQTFNKQDVHLQLPTESSLCGQGANTAGVIVILSELVDGVFVIIFDAIHADAACASMAYHGLQLEF